MNKLKTALLVAALMNSYVPARAKACDLCAVYNSVQMLKPENGTFQFGLAEQFTGHDDVQNEGHAVDNDEHQHMESSVTQLIGSYEVTETFQVQASLPYINRRFKRFENGTTATGTEAGIGDLTLVGRYFPYHYADGHESFVLQLFGGVKLPTGDSDRLAEEASEAHDDSEAARGLVLRHGGYDHEENATPSAVHGHDLALGSGSVDFPVGFNAFAQWKRLLFMASTQYVFRTEGDHDYRYANDLIWSAGPGAYLYLEDEEQVALRANLSGEYKRNDRGQEDTAINSLFIGPEILGTITGSLAANAGLDLPIDIKNSGVQAVPSYRMRVGVTYRF